MSVRDGGDTLRGTLQSLVRQVYPQWWEVIVVVHRSTDDTAALAREFLGRLPNLAVLTVDEPAFKSGAVNAGVVDSKGQALIFLDADDQVEESYLKNMGRALADASCVGARLDVSRLNGPLVRHRRADMQNTAIGQVLGFRPAVVGAAMGIRRDAFDSVGGFDPTLAQLEDVDLSWRLERQGVVPRFVPDAVLYYRYRPTLLGTFRQERAYGEAQVILYLKHRTHGFQRRSVPRVLFLFLRLLAGLPGSVAVHRRARFVTLLGSTVGRIIGSARHRVLYV